MGVATCLSGWVCVRYCSFSEEKIGTATHSSNKNVAVMREKLIPIFLHVYARHLVHVPFSGAHAISHLNREPRKRRDKINHYCKGQKESMWPLALYVRCTSSHNYVSCAVCHKACCCILDQMRMPSPSLAQWRITCSGGNSRDSEAENPFH